MVPDTKLNLRQSPIDRILWSGIWLCAAGGLHKDAFETCSCVCSCVNWRCVMVANIDYSVMQNAGWFAFYLFLIYVIFKLAIWFFGRVRKTPEE